MRGVNHTDIRASAVQHFRIPRVQYFNLSGSSPTTRRVLFFISYVCDKYSKLRTTNPTYIHNIARYQPDTVGRQCAVEKIFCSRSSSMVSLTLTLIREV